MEKESLPENKCNATPEPQAVVEAATPPEPQLPQALLETDLPLTLIRKEGARDIYDLGEYNLAIYTDRATVFDAPIEGGIPERGKCLARLAGHWLSKTRAVIPNHLKSALPSSAELKGYLGEESTFELPDNLVERCLIYKKTEPLDITFEIWGYLTGPAWKEYQSHGTVFGHPQISGLLESQSLPASVFVGFEKSEDGTRIQLSEEELNERLGTKLLEDIKTSVARIYADLQRTLRVSGKFIVPHMSLVFGNNRNKAVIADDILTPESACYWDMLHYRVGNQYYNYEMQTLKAWLTHTSWNHRGPLPQIPPEIMLQTIAKHRNLCERVTGKQTFA